MLMCLVYNNDYNNYNNGFIISKIRAKGRRYTKSKGTCMIKRQQHSRSSTSMKFRPLKPIFTVKLTFTGVCIF